MHVQRLLDSATEHYLRRNCVLRIIVSHFDLWEDLSGVVRDQRTLVMVLLGATLAVLLAGRLKRNARDLSLLDR